MAQALEFNTGQIEALMRALSVAKIIREDRNPCMIEEGLYLGSFGAANNKDALKSATIVIAYLMKKYGMSHSEAFQLVKSKRPVVFPNSGFMTQLENYDKTLKDVNTPNATL